uniref:Uncharacterized protein n=1 Tax=Amphimedon queenslandica TaxID=400682 RepID=A0A1X7SRS9_AMPQE
MGCIVTVLLQNFINSKKCKKN